MKQIIIIIYATFALVWSASRAQTIKLQNFKEVPSAILKGDDLYKLNDGTTRDFTVSVVNGQLQITNDVYSPSLTFTLPHGVLIGINRGEFGGGLYFRPNDTTKKQMFVNGKLGLSNTTSNPFWEGSIFPIDNPVNKIIRNTIFIKPGNINKVFIYRDSLYIMEGLAHMGLSFGSINNLQVSEDSITSSLVVKFDDAPLQSVVYKKNLYLATLKRFYIIRNWQKEILFDNLFWRYLYPNSIAIKDERHIYVGMRGGYAAINAKKRTIVFYLYKTN